MVIKDIFREIFKGVRIEIDNRFEPFDAYLVDTSSVDNCVINYSKNGLEKIQMDVRDKYFLKPNDIIIATIPSSTTCHVGYASSLEDKVIIKKNFIVLRNPYNDNYNLEFIAEYLENFGIKDYYENIKKNKEALVKEDIENIRIPDIDRSKQDELMKTIHPINERSRLYNKLIHNDTEIKKYLMSGVIEDEE
jgi:hypothetical protein